MKPEDIPEKLTTWIRIVRNIGYFLLHTGAGLISLTGMDIDVTPLRGVIFPAAQPDKDGSHDAS